MSTRAYQFGSWLVEPELNRITFGKLERQLEPLGMDILRHLLENAGSTVSAEDLLAMVWRGRIVESNAVPRAINLIRRALEDDPRNPRYIETIRKRGYRTIAPVSIYDPAVPGSKRYRYAIPIGLLMACLALAAGTATWWLSSRPEPTEQDAESSFPAVAAKRLIVLPFANLGSNPGDGYLADGLSEELITVLGRIDTLVVTPRTSSFYFKDRAYDLTSLADTLGVSHAIEGSVRRAGDDVSVTARLLQTTSGAELASLVVDRKLDNLLQLHREVATRIVDGLAIHLSDAEIESATDAGTGSDAAFALFLRAEELARKDNLEAWRKAKELYRAAIALDPTFHRAYHQLGDAIIIGEGYRGRQWERAAEEYQALSEQIERLHARHPDPWWNRNECGRYWIARDYPEMEAIAAQALRADPSDVFWLGKYAMLLADAGLIGASLDYWQLLQRIDPFNPEWFERVGNMQSALGRHDDAIAAYDRCLALAPERSGCISGKEFALTFSGQYEHAESFRWPGLICASPHHQTECRALVESGVDDLAIPTTLKGYVAMLGGDLDAAFEYLNQAARLPFSFVSQIHWQAYGATDLFLHDPRYEALLDKLGLTDEWRQILCRRAQALTPVTGVPVTCSTD